MNEQVDYFRAMDGHSRDKKSRNREWSTAYLQDQGISFDQRTTACT